MTSIAKYGRVDMSSPWRGILPAVITPLDENGTFVPSQFENLIGRLYDAGVHGVYVCGQAGEGLVQPLEQRKRVLEAAVRCSPSGKLVIAQVGAASTAEAIELSRHAARAGAHAISSLPPAGHYSFREIRSFYETLAASCSLPLLVYHYPEICPQMTPEGALELCSIPNVLGLKFTDYNLYGLSIVRSRGAVVFNGHDEVLAAGLLMGADGGIGAFYNVFPKTFVKIFDWTAESRWDEARILQRALNGVLHDLLQLPIVPAVRAVLDLCGIDCGRSPSPRRELTREERQRVTAIMSTLPAGIDLIAPREAGGEVAPAAD